MLKYELLEFISVIYALGMIYLFICLISQLIFGGVKFFSFILDIFLILLWPLLFFSPNGRKKLTLLTTFL